MFFVWKLIECSSNFTAICPTDPKITTSHRWVRYWLGTEQSNKPISEPKAAYFNDDGYLSLGHNELKNHILKQKSPFEHGAMICLTAIIIIIILSILMAVYPENVSVSCWTRRRHQMETFSALLAICARNSPVPGEFPAQRTVTRSFDVFFDLRLNKRLSKQSWGWWFEPISRPLWRHCNDLL